MNNWKYRFLVGSLFLAASTAHAAIIIADNAATPVVTPALTTPSLDVPAVDPASIDDAREHAMHHHTEGAVNGIVNGAVVTTAPGEYGGTGYINGGYDHNFYQNRGADYQNGNAGYQQPAVSPNAEPSMSSNIPTNPAAPIPSSVSTGSSSFNPGAGDSSFNPAGATVRRTR